ncbi:hypothetical protein MPC4_350023 [Methylocella tundrae]|uniref:Uncharacterized protein n=1 Tax=Methylocella tundrae TaxID=227605 RepID=A0A8B6M8F7_METTU|nr:hypothetical protein MPC4_350023 [Methylocella tundrae]
MLLSLLMKCECEMTMIDNVVTFFRGENDRDHVSTEGFGLLVCRILAPTEALFLHFAHSDGDLRVVEAVDGDGFKYAVASGSHKQLLTVALQAIGSFFGSSNRAKRTQRRARRLFRRGAAETEGRRPRPDAQLARASVTILTRTKPPARTR